MQKIFMVHRRYLNVIRKAFTPSTPTLPRKKTFLFLEKLNKQTMNELEAVKVAVLHPIKHFTSRHVGHTVRHVSPTTKSWNSRWALWQPRGREGILYIVLRNHFETKKSDLFCLKTSLREEIKDKHHSYLKCTIDYMQKTTPDSFSEERHVRCWQILPKMTWQCFLTADQLFQKHLID